MAQQVTLARKGDTIQLRGKNTLRKMTVGAGWDTNEGQSQHDFDLDASIVARDSSGRLVMDAQGPVLCFWDRLVVGNYLRHTGDNLTGAGDGDDEQIIVDLTKVPDNIQFLDVVVHIYDGAERRQSFGMVDNAFIRLVNDETGEETIRFDLMASDVFDETGLFFARLERSGSSWSFKAVADFSKEHATLQSTINTTVPTA